MRDEGYARKEHVLVNSVHEWVWFVHDHPVYLREETVPTHPNVIYAWVRVRRGRLLTPTERRSIRETLRQDDGSLTDSLHWALKELLEEDRDQQFERLNQQVNLN